MARGVEIAFVAMLVGMPLAGCLGAGPGQGTAGGPAEPTEGGPDGMWSEPFEGVVPAVHMALLPNGSVVYFNGDEPHHRNRTSTQWTFFTDTINRSTSAVMDLDTRKVHRPDLDPGPDLFCAGLSVRPDGSVLTVGGTLSVPWMAEADQGGPVKGTDEVFALGPGDRAWTPENGTGALPDMHLRRWYPGAVELPNGSTMAVSGIKNLTDPRTNNVMLEYLEPGGDEWRTIEPSLRFADGVEVPYVGQQGDTELAVANMPMYPRLFVVSGGPLKGEVFYASDGDIWGEFGERPAEEPIWGMYQSLNLTTGTWTVLGPSAFGVRHLGATVPLLLDPSKEYVPTLVTFGGTLQRTGTATPTTEVVTLDEERPRPEVVEELNRRRWQPQGILLPSGEIAAIGGAEVDTTIAHGQRVPRPRTAELFDPDTRTWTEVEAMDVKRGYHSTAVLTPDATVLVGGGVPNPNPFPAMRDGPTDDTPLNQSHWAESRFEIFRPPYLHHDGETRPAIVAAEDDRGWFAPGLAPDEIRVDHGETFTVNVTGLENGLDRAVLIRPGASTHGLQTDQRGVVLEAEESSAPGAGTTLTLTAPPDGAVAPPGYYMLFVNEDLGRDDTYPSKAVFVKVGQAG